MKQSNDLYGKNSKTPSEFKKSFATSLENAECSPEHLRMALKTLEREKPELFEPYQPLGDDDGICQDKPKWRLSGYFFKQVHLCEKNFSRERIEHVIEVKSHLIEYGIAGFPSNVKHQSNSESGTVVNTFKSVDLSHYTPSPALKKHVDSGDLSNIRNALFMEMNDKRLTTTQIKQAFAWVLLRKPNLFVPYEENANARAMNPDSTQWDRDYYGMQEVYANSNFSCERLSHMVEVRAQVFDIATTSASSSRPVVQPAAQRTSEEGRASQADSSYQSNNASNWLKYALFAGGAVLALALLINSIIR
ncbi:hypothetical protein [Endozoicomonas sp. SESOKO1]|uniref:hypothetical protein n=1 Tax=Endozoicomonas sp. SESOKO1 TaxID=2828742 RepID=UPI002149165B|nr:hypothetical protein [Endozoicomonas sp. SESOKO1]